MSPLLPPPLERRLRQLSTVFSVVIALAIAGLTTWLVRRADLSRETPISACSRLVTDLFANSAQTADSVLLSRLEAHREECLGDPGFVDQTRRLMTSVGQFANARSLLHEADRRRAVKPDELRAQLAWVDAAEAQSAWSDGNEARASELSERAAAEANRLREKWPEWSLPYRILEDLNQSGAQGSAQGSVDYYAMERAAQSRKLNGAWVRSQYDARALVPAFLVTFGAMMALFAAIGAALTARGMTSMPTSAVATASPGYVELRGTLHIPEGAQGVIGPHTHERGVWYELQTKSGMKKSVRRIERSAQPFVLRDATGDVLVDPSSISVHTKHLTTRLGNGKGQFTGASVTEHLLKDGDAGYLLGDLHITTSAKGETVRRIRASESGRRFFVSNYSEEELVSMEKIWVVAGLIVFTLLALLLVWGWYQRYRVTSMPGTVFW